MSSATLPPIARHDGRLYRPRKVVAYGVYDDEECLVGVVVLGTCDHDRAKALADEFVVWAFDDQYVAVDPRQVWWRNGYNCGRRAWIADPDKGRFGFWFTEIVERSGA